MDLSTLTPEDLQALKARLDGLTDDTSGRSPFRPRQLHDLRERPTAEDPRPTFFWSAEKPRNAGDLTKTTPYPRLMWSPNGAEVTVTTAKEQARREADGYVSTPPANAIVPNEADLVRAQLALLPPEDQRLLVQAAQQARKVALQDKLASFSEDELAALVAALEPAKAKKSA
jgi:hypothetical protein